MKRKSILLSPLMVSPNLTDFTGNISIEKKQRRLPEPPTEETVRRLNAIVKQAPFCYYFQVKENDCL